MKLVAGANLLTPEPMGPGWVVVDGVCIVEVGTGEPPREPDIRLDGGYLTPGLIDIHSHGGGGASVVGAMQDSVATFAAAHLRHGTTTIVASLVTGSHASLAADVVGLAELTQEGLIAGTHLEGPWISSDFCGAHDRAMLRDPDPAEVQELLRLGEGTVRMVTLAPELHGGIEATRRIVGSGAIAAVGHTNATYEQCKAAIDAGATVATHLFNAMRPVHHRSPGPIVALTEDSRVHCEVILDGVHLSPRVASFAAHACSNRILLVTDAMSAAGFHDGDYVLGELDVRVDQGIARLEDGTIAGSTLTMDRALRYAIKTVGLPLSDAVTAATLTPAKMIGLTDRGHLRVGARADMCHFTDDIELTAVWSAGRLQ